MYGYIYKTTNLVNGKIYIGQHHSDVFDVGYKGSGKILRNAIKKYGYENFSCELIEKCDTKDMLIEREIYWIKYYDAQNRDVGYNISNGGDGIVGPMPECMREHLRKMNTGKHLSEETKSKLRAKNSGKNNAFYGKKHSEETKKHISDVIKTQYINGRVGPMLGVHRYGKDSPRYGAVLSDETKKKISDSVRGFKHTDEAKRKMSNNIKGRVFINDGVNNKRVNPDELDVYLKSGWIRGRLTPWQ